MSYELIEVIAIVAACAVVIFKSVAGKFFPDVKDKFMEFYPVAMKAFAWVEKNIPDDFGDDESDPAYAKMAHKADVFIKKFTEFSIKENGKAPNDKMKKEAEKLAASLASKK